MNHQERDHLVRDIARRVFAEERSGRPVDPERLAWAANVLDQRTQPASLQVEKTEVEAA